MLAAAFSSLVRAEQRRAAPRRGAAGRRRRGRTRRRAASSAPARTSCAAWPVPSCSVCSTKWMRSSPPNAADHLVLAVADDDDRARHARVAARLQDVVQHRPAAHLVQRLGPLRLHPGRFAGGEDDGGRSGHRSLNRKAGPLGFEPRQDEPKSLCYRYTMGQAARRDDVVGGRDTKPERTSRKLV